MPCMRGMPEKRALKLWNRLSMNIQTKTRPSGIIRSGQTNQRLLFSFVFLPTEAVDMFDSSFRRKNFISTVKRDGGNHLLWGCFAALEAGQLAVIDLSVNSE